MEDRSSIETSDMDNTVSLSSLPTQQMDTVYFSNTEYEKLEKQVEELTKQLNESMKKDFYCQSKMFL
jgi:hypothetical protein